MAPRSLFPREHGAYFQLAIPLVAACLAQTPTLAALALAVAAVAAFLAYEPLAVLLGGRGPRVATAETPRARTRLLLLGSPATALGVVGLVLAPRPTLVIAAAVAVLGATLVALTARRREHSLVGELLAAVALTGASAIVLAADGASRDVVVHWWLAWAIGFALSVVAVRRILARHKHRRIVVDAALALGLAAATWLLVRVGYVTAAPLGAAAALLVALPVRATQLRISGVVIATVAALSGALALGVLSLPLP